MSNVMTAFGDRMKSYEAVGNTQLIPRMPTIIRVDGKAFHTFTKRITSYNDHTSETGPSVKMHYVMAHTMGELCSEAQNAVLGYTQSDEISILLCDYNQIGTQQWFGGRVQKIVSVAASIATAHFNDAWQNVFEEPRSVAYFDARVFQLPLNEVTNYFIWRQKDASRNSVNMIARKFFSHKELNGKSVSEVQDMLMLIHGVNWNAYDGWAKRGSCAIRMKDPYVKHKTLLRLQGESLGGSWAIDNETPIFTEDREYIERYVRGVSD